MGPPEPQAAIPAEEWRGLVERILHSPQFARSERQRDLLQYVCERAFSGEDIREQTIGFDVFGRPSTYNPASDNIVRVAARQLRQRLKEYFETAGKEEAWLLEIPKGSYVPVARRRETPPPFVGPEVPRRRTGDPRWRWAQMLVIALGAVWLTWTNQELRVRLRELTPAPNPVNSLVFAAAGPVHVVMSDATLLTIGQLSGTVVNPDDYAYRRYPGLQFLRDWPGRRAFEERMVSRQNTSLADAVLAARILRALGATSPGVRLRHARNVQARDFQADDFVLLGTIRANPWVGLFEQRLNFQYEAADAAPFTAIRNREPRAGESARYAPADFNDNVGVSYARVAMLPNLARNGRVLLIGGTAMVAMEEAGNFLLDPKSLPELRRLLGDPARLEQFELIFEVTAFEGTPKGTKLIAHRVRPARG